MVRARLVGLAAVLLLGLAAPALADGRLVRVAVFTSAECPHCRVLERDVLPRIEARFGDRLELRVLEIGDPAHYEALMAIEDEHAVPPARRVVPTAVIGDRLLAGAGVIEAELPGLVEEALARGGSSWPAAVSRLPAVAPGGEAGPAVWITFLYQTGCRECSRALADLAWVRARHPSVRVEEHNVYEEVALGEWLAVRSGRELVTPAVFVGDDALIGAGEVEARAIERLVARYEGRGAARLSDRLPTSEATADVVARFRAMGPATVAAAGLVDGINPCAFATLIFFVSYLAASGRKGKQVLAAGGAFTLGVFVAYLVVGLGLYQLLDRLGGALGAAGRVVMIVTALACAVFAALSFRDYLRARRGALGDMTLVLPDALRDRIHVVIRRGKRARYYAAVAFGTGLVVSLLELACTGQVYLPTIVFVTTVPELRAHAIGYLVLYNLLFVLPLVVVFVLVYAGTTSKQLTSWLKRRAKAVKLGMTAFFAVLALWLLVAAA